MNGVNNQSADAFAGVPADAASAIAPVMNSLRSDIVAPRLQRGSQPRDATRQSSRIRCERVQALCPAGYGRAELVRSRAQELPCAAHVRFGGVEVADRESQDVAAVQARVRNEDLAARVDRVEQSLVESIVTRCDEADDAEGYRCDALEVVALIDPRG